MWKGNFSERKVYKWYKEAIIGQTIIGIFLILLYPIALFRFKGSLPIYIHIVGISFALAGFFSIVYLFHKFVTDSEGIMITCLLRHRFVRWEDIKSVRSKYKYSSRCVIIVQTHQGYKFSFSWDGFSELYEEIKLRLREKGIIAEVEELE